MTAELESDLAALSADAAVTVLFDEQHSRLLRVAVALVGDLPSAEDVVQDAFVAVHDNWDRIADKARAAGYLHRSVVNGARSRLRRRAVAHRFRPVRPVDAVSAEEAALSVLGDTVLFDAVRALPRREREAVVLRHYLDLSERQAAEALGISAGSVKAYASRGLARLRDLLDELDSGDRHGGGHDRG